MDSSALVKRYFTESGSDTVDKIFSQKPLILTSVLTYAEIYATVYRLYREGLLSTKQIQKLLAAFEEDWKIFAVIEFSMEIRKRIPTLTKDFPLRGADAVHLASAVMILERGISMQFLASDKKLLHAAEDYGFKVIDPTET